MMATRKQRTITAAMLTTLERQCQAEYDREIKQADEAAGRGRITLAQHEYNERYHFILLSGQTDVIRRLRDMLAESEVAAW
jgi:hypothetical protein